MPALFSVQFPWVLPGLAQSLPSLLSVLSLTHRQHAVVLLLRNLVTYNSFAS